MLLLLQKLKDELQSTLHKLHKAERKSKKLRSQNDDLHEHNEKLGRQLHRERKPPKMQEASVQTNEYLTDPDTIEAYNNANEIISGRQDLKTIV